jgi:hypothetical protein
VVIYPPADYSVKISCSVIYPPAILAGFRVPSFLDIPRKKPLNIVCPLFSSVGNSLPLCSFSEIHANHPRRGRPFLFNLSVNFSVGFQKKIVAISQRRLR